MYCPKLFACYLCFLYCYYFYFQNISNSNGKLETLLPATHPPEDSTPGDSSELTWLQVALVIDRLFCAIYFMCIFIIFVFLAIKGINHKP